MVRKKRGCPRLIVYDRRTRSFFALLGRHERALTFAFGYTLHKCPKLLLRLLSQTGYEECDKVRRLIGQSEIHLEHADDFGRTDVEVRVPGVLHLILEGKKGRSYPRLDQLDRYLKRLKSHDDGDKKLWIVAERESTKQILDNYRQRRKVFRDGIVELSSFSWEEIADACGSLLADAALGRNERTWLRQLQRFVEWDGLRTIDIRTLENPLRAQQYQLISQIEKLRDENLWRLARKPGAGLFGGREPWMAYVSDTNGRYVIGLLADKKRTNWHIWVPLPKTLQELHIRLAAPVMNKCKWDPQAKEYWVCIDNPEKDVPTLKPLFQAAYQLVHTP